MTRTHKVAFYVGRNPDLVEPFKLLITELLKLCEVPLHSLSVNDNQSLVYVEVELADRAAL